MKDIIYTHIRKAIVDGELAIGTIFTDMEIANEFGISRTPVHEAFQKLEDNGYIERIPMRGNRVCCLSPRELAYSFSLRKAIETLAIRYSTLNISEAGLAELDGLLAEAKTVLSKVSKGNGLDEYDTIIRCFDVMVFEACGSTRLTEFIWTQRELFDRYDVKREPIQSEAQYRLCCRKSLFQALKARDPDAACKVWTVNFTESYSTWREGSGNTAALQDFQLQ